MIMASFIAKAMERILYDDANPLGSYSERWNHLRRELILVIITAGNQSVNEILKEVKDSNSDFRY